MEKSKLTMRILILVIALLTLAVIYAFAIRPAVTGLVTDAQVGAYNQGYIQAWSDIYSQWAQSGSVTIPLGENQALYLQQGQVVQTQQTQPTQ